MMLSMLQITTDSLTAGAMPQLSAVGVAEVAPEMTLWDLALKGAG